MEQPSSDHRKRPRSFRSFLVVLPAVVGLASFLVLGAYQLDLPGLHYDEAKEAGLNAMQLATGLPVTAFRDAAVQVGPWRLPLMVQDYIGALNVLLATPFLVVGGVNVVALRWLPLVIAALTLLLAWRLAWRLGGPVAAGATAVLLALNPSFVFWSRQGVFVTNLTALIFMASLLSGLRWWRDRRLRDLGLTAFLLGLGVYAKLLFVWVIGAMAVVAGAAWLLQGRGRRPGESAGLSHSRLAAAAVALFCFIVPLVPLIIFNIRTGGTLISIFGNLGRSYYGIDNTAYLPNLATRLAQMVTLLRGDHLWYLGHPYANSLAPWLASGLVIAAAGRGLGTRLLRRNTAVGQHGNLLPSVLLPVALLVLAVAQSAFTVSDLFITHYALLLPLLPLAGGLAVGGLAGSRQGLSRLVAVLAIAAGLAWAGLDAWTTIRYHSVLSVSGGYAGHSDAIVRLAAYLDEKGYSAPVVLDWGLDAPVRFLTAGRVSPVEVFGYERMDAPDDGFAERAAKFFENSDNVYVAHAADKAVFRGRVEALAALAGERNRLWLHEAWFYQRSGEVVFIIYRAIPSG